MGPIPAASSSISNALHVAGGFPDASNAPAPSVEGEKLREMIGDFVGDVFYGTLMRELQKSTLKSEFMHGGRGEEVFRGQLNMELARRMGRSPEDPLANHFYDTWTRDRRTAQASHTDSKQVNDATGGA